MITVGSRYRILPDRCARGAMVLDAETGAIQRPARGQDLAAFYYSLVGRGRIGESQALLAEVMAGNMPVARMLLSLSGQDVASQAAA
jgi:hypothetical protein